MRQLDRPAPSIAVRETGGVVYLSCGITYQPGLPSLVDYLVHAAEVRPTTTFLAERDPEGQWRYLTYAAAVRDTAAVATWLMRRGFGPDSAPVMILSENSIEHALMMLGALRAGVAVVPVSPTYSLGAEFARLRYALELIEPGLIYARDASRYGAALSVAAAPARRIVAGHDFRDLLHDIDDAAVRNRRSEITDDTVAKILLTSGSTGRPKGVVNTHGNIAASVQMIRLVGEPFRADRVHTVVDWLPWHHTFGGNAQFDHVLALAGTLYIDDGRPLAGQFSATIENLRAVCPTGFSCVPSVYGLLAEALESDADLRQKFFSESALALVWRCTAASTPVGAHAASSAVQALGERLPFGTGWGMTETTATGVAVYWNTERTGLVGLPQPGCTVKLVPSGDRFELRIKGPQVMPRYYRADELNAAAFDDEGFFRTATRCAGSIARARSKASNSQAALPRTSSSSQARGSGKPRASRPGRRAAAIRLRRRDLRTRSCMARRADLVDGTGQQHDARGPRPSSRSFQRLAPGRRRYDRAHAGARRAAFDRTG